MLALVMLTVTGALADDHAELSVTYEVVAQQVEEVKRKDKDLMRLDIGEHASQFRSVIIEWVLDNGLIYGSPTSLNHPFKGYTWLEYQVVKNLPKSGYMYFTHGRISTRDKIDGLFEWQLLEGDTVICGYPCKKAKTKFRGRTWTVWYTPLLPYSDGPWKFCGLPGLVLEAHEAEGKLAFHCKKIEKDTGYGIVLIKQNASPMLRKGSGLLDVYHPERAHELMMLEKYDPEAFFMAMHGELKSLKVVGSGKVYKNGKEMKTYHHTAILYEK
jgi:GLPGLI family protein